MKQADTVYYVNEVSRAGRWPRVAVTVVSFVLLLSAYLGGRASGPVLMMLLLLLGGSILVARPVLGLPALVLAALLAPLEFATGRAVSLNPAVMLTPALLVIWALDMVRRGELRLCRSRVNRPLAFLLAAGLLSFVVGRVQWDPAVPVPRGFVLVQLAQWALFALSAGALWLTGNLAAGEVWLRRLTWCFLVTAGTLAIALALSATLGLSPLARALGQLATYAVRRAPFWALLAALAGGQLLFNRQIAAGWRAFSLAAVLAVVVYAFHLRQETASNWVSVAVVIGVLVWLRFPRLRWPVVLLGVILVATGWGYSALYTFAGGDAEWMESGGSRLVLIGRVVEVTMRNPVTGLGPAAYRPYAGLEPLPYGRALWLQPQVSSHNNYVDLFSHVGLLGLGLFAWFAVELVRLGLQLRRRYTEGFAGGYVNGMLAAWAGSLVLMLFADWILPFVYNIGFPGFQASVLVWLFLGGLVALDNMPQEGAD